MSEYESTAGDKLPVITEYPEGSTELTVTEDESVKLPGLVNVRGLGQIIATSGFFKDARQASKAIVKVLAGQELGFAPMFSMSNIHVIEGKISMGATTHCRQDSGQWILRLPIRRALHQRVQAHYHRARQR